MAAFETMCHKKSITRMNNIGDRGIILTQSAPVDNRVARNPIQQNLCGRGSQQTTDYISPNRPKAQMLQHLKEEKATTPSQRP